MKRCWIPSLTLLVCLTGCGTRPAATLAVLQGEPPIATTYKSTFAKPQIGDGDYLPEVRTTRTTSRPGTQPVENPQEGGAGGADPRVDQDGAPDVEPREDGNESDGPVAPVENEAVLADVPVRTEAYAYSVRSTVTGQPTSSTWEATSDPVYLTPRYYPVLIPGSPSTLPQYTPVTADLTKVPSEAVAELDRLGRLRNRTRSIWFLLIGYSFPKISASTARARLAEGQLVWLAPDGGYWHRDKTYMSVGNIGTLDAMLPALQQDALQRAISAARESNVQGRMKVLPSFNETYDLFKLWTLEMAVDGFSYGGQPVHRGVVTAANLFEYSSVKRAVATYWQDHPECSATDLRRAHTRALADKFDSIRMSASSYAERPNVYTDAQAIPGLRDPRPIVDGDRTAHDADVNYNLIAIRAMCATMPAVLTQAMYP